MSRFGKLEFDLPEEQHAAGASRSGSNHFLEEAQRLFFQADFEPALRSYARAVEYSPQSPQAWAGQVRALIELEELREAGMWADKALERFPQNAELLASKAVIASRLGDHEGGLALSDASLELQGDVPYLWIARADVLLARRESTASYCLTRAESLAPGDWSVYWLGGRVLLYWGKLATALRLAQKAVSLNASELGGWMLAAECQLQLGLIGPAEVSARQAVLLAPGNLAATSLLQRTQRSGWMARLGGWWRSTFRKGGE